MGMVEAPWKGGPRGVPAAGPALRATLAVALVGLVLSVVAGPALGAVREPRGRDRPPAAMPEPLPPPATENPSWSGELAWASKNGVDAFDDVTGAWVQPSVVASSSTQYADTWVGVDGYDGKLLQTGTTAWTHDGTVSYEPWFVAWTGTPSGMTVIDEPLSPGDHMQVVIGRSSSGSWSVELDDLTAGWKWSTTLAYPADGSTAEWIEEAPGTWSTGSHYQTLADYGSATFTTVRADGTVPATVTTFDIAQNGAVISYPSTYDPAQGSFTVQYGQPVPAVRRMSPTSGPSTGGSAVVLSGADLGSSPVVRFGGVEATVIRSTTTSVVVRTPLHLPGEVPVTVLAGSRRGAKTALEAPARFEYRSAPGYTVVEASGAVDGFGSERGAKARQVRAGRVVAVAKDPATGGLWEVTSLGGVYDVDAPDLGTLTALVERLSIGPVSGIAATPTGEGYWLVTAKGAVYEFGAAASLGTLRRARLASPITGIAPTPTGHGYWLVSAKGAVWGFGAARAYGSAARLRLASPVAGIAPTPTGHGYWLVSAKGAVWGFGAARAYGSAARLHLDAPVVGIAASTTGHGYWLLTARGKVLAFGAAHPWGSVGAADRTSPAVGIVSS